MLTKIIPLLLLSALSSGVQALSLSIPKVAIDRAVSAKFPKEKYSVTLESPTTKFVKETQKIELCGKWSTKLPQKAGNFCIDFRPVWNKTKGDVEISKVNILKLTMDEDKNLPKSVETTLNSSLLFLLDGTSVYHAPDMIGKRMDNIEVQESSFKLIF